MQPSCLVLVLATAVVAGCTPVAPSGPTARTEQATMPTTASPAALEPTARAGEATAGPVVVGLPYKPDVQFAPLYVAQDRGYFADAGVAVRLEYGDELSFVRLVGAGEMAAMIASGEQVIMARANGIPVTYVATWYQRFPGVVFSDDPVLGTPADLVGHKVGLPVLSGASYIGWRALLAANDIDPADISTEVVGYEQLAAVLQGRVDAAVGYVGNEPVQLRARGIDAAVIEIADSFNLVSNGLVVGQDLIDRSPETVQGLVTGLLRGLAATIADPDAAFDVCVAVVPELGDPAVRDAQRAVLDASLRFWQAPRLGAIDAASWQASQDFLVRIGLVDAASPVENLIEERFVDDAVRPGS